MKINPFEKNIKSKCSVCDKSLLVDSSGNGACSNCGWFNDKFGDENEEYVTFPNVVSKNKAKKLIKEGKPLRPDLNDFLDMLYSYSEVEFWYKEKECCVILLHKNNGDISKIEFGWSPENIYYFSDKDDFIANAKIEDEYVRDIWDKVENPSYT